jgi:hypothetical protein
MSTPDQEQIDRGVADFWQAMFILTTLCYIAAIFEHYHSGCTL